VGLFIVPLGFITHPSLLALGASPLLSIAATLKVGAAMFLFSYGAIGHGGDGFKRLVALAGAGALLFVHGF
jgi:hypothetical protein